MPLSVLNPNPQQSLTSDAEYDALRRKLESSEQPVIQGPSQGVANATSLGSLGLGVASFLDSRQTAKLQRKALKQDIKFARQHNERRNRNLDSWDRYGEESLARMEARKAERAAQPAQQATQASYTPPPQKKEYL